VQLLAQCFQTQSQHVNERDSKRAALPPEALARYFMNSEILMSHFHEILMSQTGRKREREREREFDRERNVHKKNPFRNSLL
jgi:hypothetical protein